MVDQAESGCYWACIFFTLAMRAPPTPMPYHDVECWRQGKARRSMAFGGRRMRPVPSTDELKAQLAMLGVEIDDEALPGLQRRVSFYQEAMNRLDDMDFGLTEPAVIYDPDAASAGS